MEVWVADVVSLLSPWWPWGAEGGALGTHQALMLEVTWDQQKMVKPGMLGQHADSAVAEHLWRLHWMDSSLRGLPDFLAFLPRNSFPCSRILLRNTQAVTASRRVVLRGLTGNSQAWPFWAVDSRTNHGSYLLQLLHWWLIHRRESPHPDFSAVKGRKNSFRDRFTHESTFDSFPLASLSRQSEGKKSLGSFFQLLSFFDVIYVYIKYFYLFSSKLTHFTYVERT